MSFRAPEGHQGQESCKWWMRDEICRHQSQVYGERERLQHSSQWARTLQLPKPSRRQRWLILLYSSSPVVEWLTVSAQLSSLGLENKTGIGNVSWGWSIYSLKTLGQLRKFKSPQLHAFVFQEISFVCKCVFFVVMEYFYKTIDFVTVAELLSMLVFLQDI